MCSELISSEMYNKLRFVSKSCAIWHRLFYFRVFWLNFQFKADWVSGRRSFIRTTNYKVFSQMADICISAPQSRLLLVSDVFDCSFLICDCFLEFGLKNWLTMSRNFSCCKMLTILTILSGTSGTFKPLVFSLRMSFLIFARLEVPSTLRHFFKLQHRITERFTIETLTGRMKIDSLTSRS